MMGTGWSQAISTTERSKRPRIYDRALNEDDLTALQDGSTDALGLAATAAWDFSADISASIVTDISGHDRHGVTVNKPMRGATGRNWDGSEMAWPRAPEQYGAIHFTTMICLTPVGMLRSMDHTGWPPERRVRRPPVSRPGRVLHPRDRHTSVRRCAG